MEDKKKFCIYARKSSESEEKQVMSIDSQLNEMKEIAKRDNIQITCIKQESHSAKEQGQRKIFNEIVKDIEKKKYNAILTWAPDRLARNAGDLGKLVDLMDKELLIEIKTNSQTFTNNPNEKFLLMILGSQAKLENDNRGINIKRGIKTKISKGEWHCSPPTGYEVNRDRNKPGILEIDTYRARIIKEMFDRFSKGERIALIHKWLKDINFVSRRGRNLSIGNLYTILKNTFYYGEFEYPKGSGIFHQGIHQPLISKETYDKAQLTFKDKKQKPPEKRYFPLNNFINCGYCNRPIEGYVVTKGNTVEHRYYRCRKKDNLNCTNCQIREDRLITEIEYFIYKIDITELKNNEKLARYIKTIEEFGILTGDNNIQIIDKNIKKYLVHLLYKGTEEEKQDLLFSISKRFIYINKEIIGVVV